MPSIDTHATGGQIQISSRYVGNVARCRKWQKRRQEFLSIMDAVKKIKNVYSRALKFFRQNVAL